MLLSRGPAQCRLSPDASLRGVRDDARRLVTSRGSAAGISNTRNGGRSGNARVSSGIETL